MDEIGAYKDCKHKFQILNISNDRTRCQINMNTGTKRKIRIVDKNQPMSNELSEAGESELESNDESSWSGESGASTDKPAAIAPQSSSSPMTIAPPSLSSPISFNEYWSAGVRIDSSVIPPSVCPLLSRESVASCKAMGVQHQGDITECSTCGIGIELNGKNNILNEHGKKVTCLCRSTKVALLAEGWCKMWQNHWQCPACQYHEDKEKFNRASPLFIGVREHFAGAFKRDESSAKEFLVCHCHRVRAGSFLGCGASGPAMPAAAAANDKRKTTPSPPPPPPPPAKAAGPVTASNAAAPSPPVHQTSLQDELNEMRDTRIQNQACKIKEMDAKVQNYFWAALYYTSCATRIHNHVAINEMGAKIQSHIRTGCQLVEMRSCELLTLF